MDQNLVFMIKVSLRALAHLDTFFECLENFSKLLSQKEFCKIIPTYGLSTINIIRTISNDNLRLILGTIDSTFMMTTEGFIMFNTDIRWDETLDRFVEFEKR